MCGERALGQTRPGALAHGEADDYLQGQRGDCATGLHK